MHQIREQALATIPPLAGGLLDGAAFGSGGHSLPLVDPNTGVEIGRLQETTPEEVGQIVASAKRAFDTGAWAGKDPGERAAVMRGAARAIRREADMLAALDSLTTGLLWRASTRPQVEAAAAWFEFFADLVETQQAAVFATGEGIETRVTREPLGVAALFTPWNIPVMAAGLKLAASLGMGNSAVIKPSELSPLGTRRLIELLYEAGIPEGVIQIVNGRGTTTGAALAEHPAIGCVSFTGGPHAGAAIARTAASRFAKVTMELGGKSANIVLADAPYQEALEGTIAAAFGNSGQACLAGSRVLVEAPLADRFIPDLVERARALRLGHTFDERAEIGPQSSRAQLERVLAYAGLARSEGAELLCGGGQPAGASGFQVEPTIVRVGRNDLRICQEEVFGPVITVQVVADADAAAAVANDTEFGLAGYVWSTDEAKAQAVAARLRAGTVLVNSAMVRERNAPFGGFGASGLDREGGRWSLDFYSEAKATVTRTLARGSLSAVRAA